MALKAPEGYGIPASEHVEQVSLFEWWNLTQGSRPWGELMFAIPNGGARPKKTGARLKAEGVRKGVPDVFLAWPASGKCGLFIELKAPGGKVGEDQKRMLAKLEEAGYAACVALGWQEAMDRIESYLSGQWPRS